jgi:tetratricopeptide (TPR) repeat protein
LREERDVWIVRLEGEHDNVRAALDWAERAGEPRVGLRTATALWRFWQQRGHLSEGRARLERLLGMEGAQARDEVRARALGALGSLAYWQNDHDATRKAYEEALAIAREVGDPGLVAAALRDLSYVAFVDQDLERAPTILREQMAAAEEAGDRALVAEAWTSLGFISVFQGNPQEAIEPLHRALRIFREEGLAWKVADHLGGLGLVSRLVGDLEGSKGFLREALEMSARATDSSGISMSLRGLAMVANDQGRYERAARLTGAATRILDDLGESLIPALADRWGAPAEEEARSKLGGEAYERARAEGYAMDQEQALAYAFSDDEG